MDDENGSGSDDLYLLTIDQVAERLGVHPQTVRGYIADGELSWVNMGGQRFVHRRVTLAQLADFVARHSVEARS